MEVVTLSPGGIRLVQEWDHLEATEDAAEEDSGELAETSEMKWLHLTLVMITTICSCSDKKQYLTKILNIMLKSVDFRQRYDTILHYGNLERSCLHYCQYGIRE